MYSGLILGFCIANERSNAISHWLGANLENLALILTKRHSIAGPWWRGAECVCVLWVHSLTHIMHSTSSFYSKTCIKRPLNLVVSQDRWSIIAGRINMILLSPCQANEEIYVFLVRLTRSHYTGSTVYVDGLEQDCSNSSANTLELLQSCTKPLMWYCVIIDHLH